MHGIRGQPIVDSLVFQISQIWVTRRKSMLSHRHWKVRFDRAIYGSNLSTTRWISRSFSQGVIHCNLLCQRIYTHMCVHKHLVMYMTTSKKTHLLEVNPKAKLAQFTQNDILLLLHSYLDGITISHTYTSILYLILFACAVCVYGSRFADIDVHTRNEHFTILPKRQVFFHINESDHPWNRTHIF